MVYAIMMESLEVMEDLIYIVGEGRVVLIGGDVTFDLFESLIKRISGSESSFIKSILSLKFEIMSFCAHVLVRGT